MQARLLPKFPVAASGQKIALEPIKPGPPQLIKRRYTSAVLNGNWLASSISTQLAQAVAAVKPASPGTRYYKRRRPEQTLWYRTVQTHLETWLALAAGHCDESPPAYVEPAFRRYLECGILVHLDLAAWCLPVALDEACPRHRRCT